MSSLSQAIISLEEILNNDPDGINEADQREPLPSESQMGSQLNNIPLRALNTSAIIQLTDSLNVEQLITTDEGFARDYRGLSEQMGFSYIELENFRRNTNPTKVMLDTYVSRRPQSSINDLIKLLEKIERYDIVDDLSPHLQNILNRTTKDGGSNRLQVTCEDGAINSGRSNTDLLTIDDVVDDQLDLYTNQSISTTLMSKLQPRYYDAFVCYADEDTGFVHKLIKILESCNISILTKERLLAGHIEFDAITQSIDQRCGRTIIILSPQFLESSKCVFQSKFAYALAYEQEKINMRKIIPVIYKPCTLPHTIIMLSKVDLTRGPTSCQKLKWSLERLVASIIDNDASSSNRGRDININLEMASHLHEDEHELPASDVYNLKIDDSPTIDINSDFSQQITNNYLDDRRVGSESGVETQQESKDTEKTDRNVCKDQNKVGEAENEQRMKELLNLQLMESQLSHKSSSICPEWMKRIKRRFASIGESNSNLNLIPSNKHS